MTDQPLVSIVTPSLNQCAFLGQTLDSIAAQDYPRVQMIVVDGGSTDGSVELISAFARKRPGSVRWVSEPDRGQADAINKGFAMADGDIVTWLNADDAYVFRRTLGEVVAAFQAHPDADVIYGDVAIISSDNRLLRVQCIAPFSYGRLLRGCYLSQPAVFWRRKVMMEERLDATLRFVMDYEYWLRLGRRYRFLYVPRLWAADRNHPSRKMLAHRQELIVEGHDVLRRCGQSFGVAYGLLRLGDKLRYGLPSRVRGLGIMLRLRRQSGEGLAIPLRHEALAIALVKQLWTKNRDVR